MKQFWKSIYKKRSTFYAIAIISILVFVFFGSNFYTIYRLEKEKSALTQQIEDEKDRSESLDAQLKTVGTKSYIEKVAREKYKLYYPDELVVTPTYDQPKSE